MSKTTSKVSNENKQGMFFCPSLLKNRFWERNFENLTLDSESALPRYDVRQVSGTRIVLTFLAQICPKNSLGVKISKGLNNDRI